MLDALPTKPDFQWPEGIRAAVSLSFDDARPSQVLTGVPLLNRLGIKATFYALPCKVEEHLEAWREAVAAGHEIGNHSLTHPCSANFQFAQENPLETYTLDRMARELDEANGMLQELLGVKPVTFAYPCGQDFVGRGTARQSYVPLIAERFLVGRGFFDERHGLPGHCDLAKVYAISCDAMPLEALLSAIRASAEEGGWLILAGHEIGPQGAYQCTLTSMLEDLAVYAAEPANGIWLDTVAAHGRYVHDQRATHRPA